MYLYNTTFVIENNELEWWSEWMKKYYLPTFFDVVPSVNNELYRLERNAQAADSTTYSCQWRCNTLQELGEVDKYSKSLLNNLMKEKGEKCLSFVTMMESVEL